jgi:Na+/proline symporter
MGAITIVYDAIGGIKAVVYSDVIQGFILIAGIFLAVGYGLYHTGGIEAALTSLPPERWRALDPTWGLGDGSDTPSWGACSVLSLRCRSTCSSESRRTVSTSWFRRSFSRRSPPGCEVS